jgi:hypothetical protein
MPFSPRRIAVVIWAGLVGGVVVFSGVALLVPMGGSMGPELASALLAVTLAVAAISVALSFWIPRRMRPGGAVVTPDQLAMSRSVVAGALCEGPALFAVLGVMLTRDASLLLPYALSLVALLAHFPGAARWERLRSGGGPGGPGAAGGRPPARMVRE